MNYNSNNMIQLLRHTLPNITRNIIKSYGYIGLTRIVSRSKINPKFFLNLKNRNLFKSEFDLNKNFHSKISKFTSTNGNVISIADGIAKVDGLNSVKYGELVEFSSGTKGMALNLETDNVGIIVLGEDRNISKGDKVYTTNTIVDTPVGKELLGRVVDGLGNPIDGKLNINSMERREIDVKAPGIMDRKSIQEQLFTGIKFIDTLIPIGLGQREAIVGDRQTGKTSLAINIIINQRKYYDDIKTRKYCIYVAIGQKRSSVAQIVKILEKYDALKYTIVVAATASNAASLQFIAPYTGCTMGEWFRDNGEHCIIVYDDLSKQAIAYRQISLLLRRLPGREAYPGDIFYIHSRLLERSSKLCDFRGGGSLTALPIVETQSNNFSSFIPTNITSITDGQIFLDNELFSKGKRPAFNLGLSISRIGSSTQLNSIKQVSNNLKLDLLQFKELEKFSNSNININNDKNTSKLIRRGKIIDKLFQQDQFQFTDPEYLTCLLFAGYNGYLDHLNVEDLKQFEKSFYKFLHENYSKDILNTIKISAEFDEFTRYKLIKALNHYFNDSSVVKDL